MTNPMLSDTAILGDRHSFETTQWHLVRAASDVQAQDALIRIYWKPLYFFVRRLGYSNEPAKDIVQGFLTTLLERRAISRADPGRGKFRTFLLASLKNYLKDWSKSVSRKKRGGEAIIYSLDFAGGEREYVRQVAAWQTPEMVLNQAWARSLLEQSISEMEGPPAHLEAFRAWLAEMDFKAISLKTGLSESAAKSAVHRLRGELRRIVTGHLRQTGATEEEIKTELAEFVSLFA
jgi:RNA polymerase sigma factor (sigma-70 family)